MNEPTQHLSSLGHMSQCFQRPVQQIAEWLRFLGCEPRLVLNGVEYYDAAAHEAILWRHCGRLPDGAPVPGRSDLVDLHGPAAPAESEGDGND